VASGLVAEVTLAWLVLGISFVTNFFGYFMIWLVVTRKTNKPTVWLIRLYIFIKTSSENFSTILSVVALVKNFPKKAYI
jgi:hypothetical protein